MYIYIYLIVKHKNYLHIYKKYYLYSFLKVHLVFTSINLQNVILYTYTPIYKNITFDLFNIIQHFF